MKIATTCKNGIGKSTPAGIRYQFPYETIRPLSKNYTLPEFRGKGDGQQQMKETLRGFRSKGAQRVKTSTLEVPYFLTAQHRYLTCGFKKRERIPWNVDPNVEEIHYEWKEENPYG